MTPELRAALTRLREAGFHAGAILFARDVTAELRPDLERAVRDGRALRWGTGGFALNSSAYEGMSFESAEC